MSTSTSTMTKAQARKSIARARDGLRWMELALREGNAVDLEEACNEVNGAVAQVQEALDLVYGQGIRGVKVGA